MAWNGGENGGFTSGKPWLRVHSRYQEINVEKDLASEKSVYRFYQKLLRLRRETPAFLDGSMKVISSPDDAFFVYTRSLGEETWAVVCNFESEQRITLPFRCEKPVLSNMERESADGMFAPYECAVARVIG